jgi:hypothetical protein
MRAASDIADWWEEQHRQSKKALDRFVDDNPNLFGVLVATTVATAMELGAGTVDVLRVGEGAAAAMEADSAWGVAKGVARDTLRVISIAGALGKGAKLVQSARGVRLAKLIVDPGGNRCAYVAATQALRETGQRAFAAVDDLAAAMGRDLGELAGVTLPQLGAELRAIGARVGNSRFVTTLEDVVDATRRDGSVTMIILRGVRIRNGRPVGHAVYSFYDALGRFRIMDRGGRAGALPEVFEDLGQLAAKYGVNSWMTEEVAVLENVFLKFVGPKGMATLAMEVLAVTHDEPETVAQAFEARKHAEPQADRAPTSSGTTTGGRKGTPSPPRGRFHTVVVGDWLSKIARTHYGNMHKWPVIYEANRRVIGDNPSLIKPGQVLWVPDLSAVKGIKNRS